MRDVGSELQQESEKEEEEGGIRGESGGEKRGKGEEILKARRAGTEASRLGWVRKGRGGGQREKV